MATLTVVDLYMNASVIFPKGTVVEQHLALVNFGSPRVGNEAFATFTSNLLKDFLHYRITHLRDIVPHLPWFEGYTHIDGEWYEDENHVLHACAGYEDVECADQWYFLSIEDHLLYLNFTVTCESVSEGYVSI